MAGRGQGGGGVAQASVAVAKETHGTLQLFDSQGRLMNDIPLGGQLAFKVIPLNGYAEGLYLTRVILDGFVLGETKFTVIK